MKKIQRIMLCSGVLAALMCTSSLAAEPEEVPMLVNGEAVVFPDAVPVFRGDSIDVPAVATLEALGFTITWDEASQTITAEKDGRSVSLVIGEDVALWDGPGWSEVSEDGTSATGGTSGGAAILSKVPYVDPSTWRTYIAAEDLEGILGEGFRVAVEYGWTMDAAGGMVMSYGEMAVVVDDVDAIWEANTETYELMDQYMEYSQRYSEGNYRVNGSFAMSVSDAVSTAMGLEGDYDMVTSQTALQFDTELALNMDVDGLEVVLPNLDIDLRCDVETGKFYFQSQALTSSDAWYSLDMKSFYDELYGPGYYESLVALSMASVDQSFTQALEEILRSDLLPISQELTTADYLAVFNGLFGDSAFEQSGSTYVSSWEQDGASLQFILYTSRGQVNGYGVELSFGDETGEMALDAEMRGDKMTMTMDMDLPEIMQMTMGMDGTYQSSRTAPDAQPPAGAEVVDLMELMIGEVEPAPEPAAEA